MTTTRRQHPGALRRLLTWVLLNGRGPMWLMSFLHTHMRADHVWSAHYDAMRRVEQIAARADFGPDQTAFVERMIVVEFHRRHPQRDRLLRRALATALVGLSGATAGLLLFFGADSRLDDRWTTRSAATEVVGLRVRCVDRLGQRVFAEAEVGPGVAQGGLACPRGGLLSFSTTNRTGDPRHVFVVGVSETGELRWYAPFVERGRSVAIPVGAVDELLLVVADTSAMPHDERVTLHALFSAQAIEGADVARLVRGAASRGVAVGALERLPIPGVQQGRLELLEAATQ